MKKIIYLLLTVCCLLATGCKTKQALTPAPGIRDSINIIDRYNDIFRTKVKDSINVRDSIVIHADGSISRWHSELRDKSRDVYHKITINKKHFHTTTITKVVAVTRPLKWYEKIFILIGKVSSSMLAAWLIWSIAKNTNPILNFIRKVFGNQK